MFIFRIFLKHNLNIHFLLKIRIIIYDITQTLNKSKHFMLHQKHLWFSFLEMIGRKTRASFLSKCFLRISLAMVSKSCFIFISSLALVSIKKGIPMVIASS